MKHDRDFEKKWLRTFLWCRHWLFFSLSLLKSPKYILFLKTLKTHVRRGYPASYKSDIQYSQVVRVTLAPRPPVWVWETRQAASRGSQPPLICNRDTRETLKHKTMKCMSEMVNIPRPQVQPWHGWRGLSQHNNKLAIVGDSRKIFRGEVLCWFCLFQEFLYLMCNCCADLGCF